MRADDEREDRSARLFTGSRKASNITAAFIALAT